MLKKKLSYIGFGGNGFQCRDVIHIDDVCEIIYLQLKKLNKIHNETFNIGGGKKNVLSLKDLTLLSEKLTNKTIKFKSVSKTLIYDIPYFVTDNKKIQKFYKWCPRKNINQILKDIFIWLRQNKMILKYFK